MFVVVFDQKDHSQSRPTVEIIFESGSVEKWSDSFKSMLLEFFNASHGVTANTEPATR